MVAETRSFIGPLTERQQLFWDKWAAEEALMTFVPEKCQGCRELRVFKAGVIAAGIASGELTITDGTREIISYTAECVGPEYSATHADSQPICPPYEAEKRSWVVR